MIHLQFGKVDLAGVAESSLVVFMGDAEGIKGVKCGATGIGLDQSGSMRLFFAYKKRYSGLLKWNA